MSAYLTTVEALTDHISTLNSRMSSLETDLKYTISNLQDSEKTNRDLRNRISELEDEQTIKLNNRIKELNNEVEFQRKVIKDLKTQNSKLELNVRQLEKDFIEGGENTLIDENKKLKAHNFELGRIVADLKEIIDRKEKRYEEIFRDYKLVFDQKEIQSKLINDLQQKLNDGAIPYLDPKGMIPEKEIVAWDEKNFGKTFPTRAIELINMLMNMKSLGAVDYIDDKEVQSIVFQMEKSIGYRYLLGATEELGELCHAHLKTEQGIRIGTDPEKSLAAKKDAVGDIGIFLTCYCASQGFTLVDAILSAFGVISKRNWDADKIAGERFVGDFASREGQDMVDCGNCGMDPDEVAKIEWDLELPLPTIDETCRLLDNAIYDWEQENFQKKPKAIYIPKDHYKAMELTAMELTTVSRPLLYKGIALRKNKTDGSKDFTAVGS